MMSEYDLQWYNSFGICMEKNKPVLDSMDVFMTVFYDLN
jgi:hypothetical protein